MGKRIKWLITCVLLIETGVLCVRFYQDWQRSHAISALESAPSMTAVSRDLQVQDQAFAQTVLGLVAKYYVHADQLPYGAWLQEAMRLLQEGQFATYSPTSSTLSFEEHSIVVTLASNMDEVLSKTLTISEFLNQTRFRKEWETAKDLSPGCEHMLEALMQALDPHSVLMPQDAYADLRQTTEGKFGGVGLMLRMENDILSIGKVIAHSPAEREGLMALDRILAIDGTSTYGKSLDDITALMRGDSGATVRLSILHGTDWGPREVYVRREMIQVPSVEVQDRVVNKEHFLQLKVLSFSQHTTQEVIAALHQAEKKNKLTGLILDLRENPGGLLDEAIHMASLFLPKGVVVRMRGQMEESQSVIPVKQKWTLPIVTMMNENSASASEILAGALKDHHRTVVVGTRSYGKASVQTIFELPYSFALKLTIARYYTPNGTSIQDKGIMPDIWLQPVEEKEENRDLMGEDRYRTEKFIVNSTQAQGAEQSSPTLVGYYVARPHMEDRTLELALAVLAKSHPFVSLHHSREIQSKLASWTQEATHYLAAHHQVQWEGSPIFHQSLENLTPVTFSISMVNPILHPHEIASAVYEIRNEGTTPLHELSVLFTDPELLNTPVEALIGTLPPLGRYRGTLKLMPGEGGATPLSMQLAQSGVIQRSPQQTIPLAVLPYPVVHLESKASFTAENSLSSLEANGTGMLHVRVINTGEFPIHHVAAKLCNLGGKQVELQIPVEKIEILAPGEMRVFDFPVKGGQQIATSTIDFGIQIEGDELPQTMRQSFAFGAVPACELSARRIP